MSLSYFFLRLKKAILGERQADLFGRCFQCHEALCQLLYRFGAWGDCLSASYATEREIVNVSAIGNESPGAFNLTQPLFNCIA